MIISKNQVQNILKIYGQDTTTNKAGKVKGSRAVSRPDQLAISSESKIKQRALQAAKQADDIRLDRVNQLQEQVSAGTYTVADDEVAEKMIARAIVDRLV